MDVDMDTSPSGALNASITEMLTTCIHSIYLAALNRRPQNKEVKAMLAKVTSSTDAREILALIENSEEFKEKKRVTIRVSPGHYYSPIVDPGSVMNYVTRERGAVPKGVELDWNGMREFWLRHLNFVKTTPFTDDKTDERRYFYNAKSYPQADAILLRAVMGAVKPKRAIEIGSGYSSAAFLDIADELSLPDFHLTCIEPYPDRLRAILREEDWRRVRLIESPVQDVSPEIVQDLQAGDILFIDSSHVLKTGSDVHFELFELLPRLRAGVLIHIHDVRYPFEYPDPFIFERNYSWTEAYGVRAFLLFNQHFKVFLWGSGLVHHYGKQMRTEYAKFMEKQGSSIWIERVS